MLKATTDGDMRDNEMAMTKRQPGFAFAVGVNDLQRSCFSVTMVLPGVCSAIELDTQSDQLVRMREIRESTIEGFSWSHYALNNTALCLVWSLEYQRVPAYRIISCNRR